MAAPELSKQNLDKKGRLNLDSTMAKIIALLMRHSPHELTMSKISRFVNVPRSTLYYYFGKDVSELLTEAVRFGMKKFIQAESLEDYKRFPSWMDYQCARLEATLSLVEYYPWAPRVYFRYRDDPGYMGKTIREMEEEWIKGQRKAVRYYSSKAPSAKFEKVAGAVKLGFLWAVATEYEDRVKGKALFEGKQREYVVKKVCELASEFLNSDE